MNKIELVVTENVKFISDWKDYVIPFGHCIIDKGVTGCGFTEFCLSNQDNIILCSPRKLLLENKVEQHPSDRNILYLKNDFEKTPDFDSPLTDKATKEKKSAGTAENFPEHLAHFQEILNSHITFCQSQGLPVKILVTYDSFKYVKTLLSGSLGSYKIVIDEYQSIFTDSTFKSEVELGFLDYLRDCPNVCYLSATPMLDPYLEQLDEFKNLDMYKLNWPSSYTEQVRIIPKKTKSVVGEIKNVIGDYLNSRFPQIVDSQKRTFYSHEMVVYLNSVTDIISIITSCGLNPSNTDIICSNTPKNRKKLRRIGFSVSKPNTYENRHLNKMFTFCTRTVYLGADFYSDNASTYILSNPNKRHLAIDISIDLPQIAGRQRLRTNPFRSFCTLFYQTTNFVVNEKEFSDICQSKLDQTNLGITMYNAETDLLRKDFLKSKLKDSIQLKNYSDDYIGFSRTLGCPVFNQLVYLSEIRSWEVTQGMYSNSITVRSAIEEEGYDLSQTQDPEILRIAGIVNNRELHYEDRLACYCEARDTYEGNPEFLALLGSQIIDPGFSNLYNLLGHKKIKALRYRKLDTQNYYDSVQRFESVSGELDKYLTLGSKYFARDLKAVLQKVYTDLGLTIQAKAVDIMNYYNAQPLQWRVSGKREHGYLLIGKVDFQG